MLDAIALAAVVIGGSWWLWCGARRARRLYRLWRWRNSVAVYGWDEIGRAWPVDAATAAMLALGGPLVPRDLDAGRAGRGAYFLVAIVWLLFVAGELSR